MREVERLTAPSLSRGKGLPRNDDVGARSDRAVRQYSGLGAFVWRGTGRGGDYPDWSPLTKSP